MINLTEGLNQGQKRAVTSHSDIMLVLAGAGSGKTTVLTRRVADLILNRGVPAGNILAVTFTNKASKEMSERVSQLLGHDNMAMSGYMSGTFHSICHRMLRGHHEAVNLPRNFEIMDSSDQSDLIKIIVSEMVESHQVDKEEAKIIRKEAQDMISSAKDKGLRPDSSAGFFQSKALGFDMQSIYEKYEERRLAANMVDFGDLILYTVEMLRDNDDLRRFYKNRFQYILVDEYQDTNLIQFEFIKLLFSKSLFVVGDDDQSIYGWRGAEIKHILQFSNVFDDVEVVKLEDNYRSTERILSCANSVIENNQFRHDKRLRANKEEGDKITIVGASDTFREAEYISNQIAAALRSGYNTSDCCVLYRTNAVSRAIESQLTKDKIPYKIVGGLAFWARAEIKDVMSYVSLGFNSNNPVAFQRTINQPSRGIGPKSVSKIFAYANDNGISPVQAAQRMVSEKLIKGKAASSLGEYIEVLKSINSLIRDNTPIDVVIAYILDKTNITELVYKKEGSEKYDDRVQNLQELISFAKTFEPEDESGSLIEDFISQATLQGNMDKGAEDEAVQMMTIHAAKGLEFPIVFIAGVEDGLFPSSRSSESRGALEEERRLAYVAITRAMKNLTITNAAYRYNRPMTPSRFLGELSEKDVVHKSFGGYGGYNGYGGGGFKSSPKSSSGSGSGQKSFLTSEMRGDLESQIQRAKERKGL